MWPTSLFSEHKNALLMQYVELVTDDLFPEFSIISDVLLVSFFNTAVQYSHCIVL
jgi:hypothetical protein